MAERDGASGLYLNADIEEITKDDDVHQPNREVVNSPVRIRNKKSNTALNNMKNGPINARTLADS